MVWGNERFVLQLEQLHWDPCEGVFILFRIKRGRGRLSWDIPAWLGHTDGECGRGGWTGPFVLNLTPDGHKDSLGCNRDGPGPSSSLRAAFLRKNSSIKNLY